MPLIAPAIVGEKHDDSDSRNADYSVLNPVSRPEVGRRWNVRWGEAQLLPRIGSALLRACKRVGAAAAWVAALSVSMGPIQAAGRQMLHGHVPQGVASSAALGRLAGSARINFAIGLPLRNEAELNELVKQVADPASPNFRHYLTPAQFTERFGPSEADYKALTDFVSASGLQVSSTHPNRMILEVSGTAADTERTLHVNMMRWRHATRGVYFAPDREPSLDAGVEVLDISGLDNFVLPRPMDVKSIPLSQATPMVTGSAPGGLFIGNDFRSAYAPGVTLNGAGQSIGLFELDGFYASDVQANFQKAGLPALPVETVLVNGFSGAPGGANIEVILDIMMAAYMAPGASKIIVYEGVNWNAVLNRMATDNLASQLSSSWCFSPTNATTEQIFKQMIAQGQSLFQASGDSGAYKGLVFPPADDPNLTVVGGTSLTTAGAGGAWLAETAWSGSGGGISTVWPIPSYQQTVNMAAVGGSATMRNIPDVALTADVQMYLIQNNGHAVSVGGTSAAAPLWAGFMALANQQAAANGKPPVGFLNPLLYQIGAGSRLQQDLHDISAGNNKGFNALSGYDLATGWGSPAGQSLIDDLTGLSNPPGFSLGASTSALSLTAGASGSSMITINAQNGFSDGVNLAASGLPAGVTATFSPATAATASTLTMTASSSAAVGTSTITVVGVSGSLTSTAKLTLTVAAAPTFTLTAAPASVILASGGTSASTITVTPQNGFNGIVSLAVSGLPSGVTGSFGALTAAGTSTLALTGTASATPGTWALTVTGTSGTLTSKAAISLTVNGPVSFTLSASPAVASVALGSTTVAAMTVTPHNGFTGAVALVASGLPSGVTASFSPASTTAASTLTLSASISAAAGTYSVTVTGTSGSLRATATLSLTVVAAPSYTIAASPATLTVARGSAGTTAIKVTPQNGFNGAVSLAASGLPSGVTASFSPASTTGASTLKLTATASAALGTATVTITGTSGSLRRVATLSLVVCAAPNFRLVSSPTSVSVLQGGTAASTIAVSRQNGFTGTVALSLTGLPSGVTGTFSPASTDRLSTLTFAAATSAPIGTTTVTVTGVSGTIINKLTIAITVTAASSVKLTVAPAGDAVRHGKTAAAQTQQTVRLRSSEP